MDRKKPFPSWKYVLNHNNDCVNWNLKQVMAMGSTLTLATLLVFQASKGTLDANAQSLAVKSDIARYNVVAHEVAYNEVDAIANIAKEILEGKVNVLSQPLKISEEMDRVIYSFEDYIIEVFFNSNHELGEYDVKMTIQTQATYAYGSGNTIDAQNNQNDTEILEGMVYTYYPKIKLVDRVAPVIKKTRSTITIDDTDDFDINDYVQAVDAVDGKVNLKVKGMFKETEEGRYQPGDYTLTVNATDQQGNSSSTKLNVIVNNTRRVQQSYGNYGVSPYAGNVVSEARNHIGKAYVWGAEGPYAFDCSGLVKYVYGRAGVALPHSSYALSSVGVAINPYDRSLWRAGDLVVYEGHVAIYSGNNTIIHALNESAGVVETGIINYNGPVIAVRRVM